MIAGFGRRNSETSQESPCVPGGKWCGCAVGTLSTACFRDLQLYIGKVWKGRKGMQRVHLAKTLHSGAEAAKTSRMDCEVCRLKMNENEQMTCRCTEMSV